MADEEENSVAEEEEPKETEPAPESEDSEASLEEIAADDFSTAGFEVHDMPTPTLASASDSIGDSSAFRDESLEENTQGASEGIRENTRTAGQGEQETYRVRDETEISYAQIHEQRRLQGLSAEDLEKARRSNFLTQQKVDLEDFDQRKMGDNSPTRSDEYELLEIDATGEPARRLPFERNTRKDYSILKKLKK